eukprot:UN1384
MARHISKPKCMELMAETDALLFPITERAAAGHEGHEVQPELPDHLEAAAPGLDEAHPVLAQLPCCEEVREFDVSSEADEDTFCQCDLQLMTYASTGWHRWQLLAQAPPDDRLVSSVFPVLKDLPDAPSFPVLQAAAAPKEPPGVVEALIYWSRVCARAVCESQYQAEVCARGRCVI